MTLLRFRILSITAIFATFSLLVSIPLTSAVNAKVSEITSISAVSLETQTAFLPLIQNRYDHEVRPPVFGVQMYGNTTSPPFHSFLLDSGASWLRASVSWRSAQEEYSEPPIYDWADVDGALSAARSDSGELSMIATISDNPAWAATYSNGPIDPEDMDSFVAFVQAVVERYDGDGLDDAPTSPVVTHWEFYNEPDNTAAQGGDPHWGGEGDQYAQMLASIYSPVKTANPDAQVLLGGLAYDWFIEDEGPFDSQFLDDVLSAGGGDYFDIMNFHIYPYFWSNWTDQESPALLEKAEYLRDVLAGYGYSDKPFVITEAGWHSNVPDNPDAPASSPEEQARYVVELFTQAIAADSDGMIWWMLYDIGGFYPYDNGLITNEAVPQTKPSFTAYQVISSELETAVFQRILSDAETKASDMEAYEFIDRIQGRAIYIAWLDPVDASGTKPLKVPASTAVIRTIYGEPFIVLDGQDGRLDGFVTVNIGAQPKYIEVEW